MHRVAAVASGNAAVPRQDQAKPIDFLKRLEQLEAESAAPSTNAPPSAAAMMPAWARNDPSGVVGGAPKFKSMKKRTNGEDAETILSQLNEIQNSIDEIRTRQRERTPPEKHVGENL
jgi:hypothetical protein